MDCKHTIFCNKFLRSLKLLEDEFNEISGKGTSAYLENFNNPDRKTLNTVNGIYVSIIGLSEHFSVYLDKLKKAHEERCNVTLLGTKERILAPFEK